MVSEWIQILYPRRCPICERIVTPAGRFICQSCYDSLQVVLEPRCKKCGKPIEKEEQEYCYDCGKREFSYEYGYGMWIYDEFMRHSLSAFKYKNKREYADFYVEELLRRYTGKIQAMGVDVIVPVPVHKKKRLARGYNQAELLAKGIARALQLPMEPELLVRCKNTLPQKTLNDQERFLNLQQAFLVNPERKTMYRDKKILLVDDIYTTGSTIEVCTRALLQQGIKQVYFISLCIGKGY